MVSTTPQEAVFEVLVLHRHVVADLKMELNTSESSWLNVRCTCWSYQLRFSAKTKPAIQYVDRHNVICKKSLIRLNQWSNAWNWWSFHSDTDRDLSFQMTVWLFDSGRNKVGVLWEENKEVLTKGSWSISRRSKDVWDDDQTHSTCNKQTNNN